MRSLTAAACRIRDPDQAAALIRRARATQAEVEALWRRLEPFAADDVALYRGTPQTKSDLNALISPGRHPEGRRSETGHSPGKAAEDRPSAGEHPAGQGGHSTARTPQTGMLGFYLGADAVTVLAHRTGWVEPRAFATTVDQALVADFAATIGGDRPGLLDIDARRHRLGVWRRMADLLMKDALEALGDDLDHLHLLPHGALHRLPLHALAPDGRSLFDRFPVTYAPSAATLSRLARRDPVHGSRSLVLGHAADPADRPALEAAAEDTATLLGIHPHLGQAATAALLGFQPHTGSDATAAMPHLSQDATAAMPRLSPDATAPMPHLGPDTTTVMPHLGPEATAAMRGSQSHAGPDATADPHVTHPGTGPDATAAAQQAGSWDVIHLSCHGVLDQRDPFGSGIRLADGVLTARQIVSMNLNARLVVLTGCETPLSTPASGDGVAALVHALLHAGARSVLLTLWPVSAEITRALVRDFHTRLRDGTGPARALRGAVLELRDLYGSAEPGLWAPYVLAGLP
ncbi:CHAT domain-containing protein [Nonomuraea sp. K274]|uniref:CHAT domain-containing protein n=1 Tax=Nonomuraea cypriaca TaxID=1187855 RepID=A0A931F0T3_9ACTN|nr:CHAT domain-containing protein [Nonomuraea cypriaca]